MGELIGPTDDRYGEARLLWNARFDAVRPVAIAPCRSAAEVAEAIALAAGKELPIAVRSGGHDFAGGSVGPGLVIDLAGLGGVEVTDGAVRIGAGARLGEVYPALDLFGLALPGGTCPEVGIGGLTLGGGLGPLGRSHGLLADRLVEAEVVLADGRTVTCAEGRHGDLFWALRGAGSLGFGVVTALTFAPTAAPEHAVDVHLGWPQAAATELIPAWQRWAPAAPDPLAASLKFTVPAPPEGPRLDLYATFFGRADEAERLLDELSASVSSEPASRSIEESTYPRSRAFWASLGDTGDGDDSVAPPPRERAFVKSRFFREPFDARTVAALLEATLADPAPSMSRELDFTPWAGAYTRRGPDETAFAHRDAVFLLKLSTDLRLDGSPDGAAVERVERMAAATGGAARSGSFQNFADPALDPWDEAYHGANVARLREVKARYDPDGLFG